MTKFYTADLHHKHKNICKMTDRNLSVDKEQHDEWPTDEAIKINSQRINERLKQMESRGVK